MAPLLIVGSLSACSPVEPGPDADPASFHVLGEGEGRGRGAELVRHRRIWEARAPSTYAFVVTRQCFCLTDVVRPVRVEASDDGSLDAASPTVRATYADTGEPVPEQWRNLSPTVDGLFALLEEAVDRGADTIRVSWHADLGYPTRIWIDYETGMADEELGFLAADLAPVP